MAKQTINNSDSGLVIRTSLNSNFTELYNGVQFAQPVTGDNSANINDAITALGDEKVLRLLPGGTFNIDGSIGITLIDGLTIEGNGATIGYSDGGGYVFDLDTDIEVTMNNLTVRHSLILNQSDGTLNLNNVKFGYYSVLGDAEVTTSGGIIEAVNLDLDGIKTSSLFGNDTMVVRGGHWLVSTLGFTGNGTFDLTLSRLEKFGSLTGRFNLGPLNPYNMISEHSDWETFNSNNELVVRLSCPFSTDLIIIANAGADVTIMNGNYLNGAWSVYARAYMKVYNCTGSSGNVDGAGMGILEIDNCYIRKDLGKDLVPYPDDIYNEANWGTSGLFVDHIYETFNSVVNDYGYPLYIIRNSVLEYMGDDVLNSLPDSLLLAELEAHPYYTEDSESDPSIPPVTGTWAVTTAYTTGDALWSPANWNGGAPQKFAMLVMEDHTSTSSIQDDIYAGKIRVLFGANRQPNGKYQQLIYLQSAGWYATFKPTLSYSGGKKRNRGNGMNIRANMIIEDSKIIDHACVYSTRIGVSQAVGYTNTGALAYPQFAMGPLNFCLINNVDIEFRGGYNGQHKTGISIQEPLDLEHGEFTISNIRAIGEGLHSVIQLTSWTNAFENKLKIGPLYRQHGDIVQASYWPNRYNSENFITGSSTVSVAGYTFNELINYICDFKNEVRDENTYPIVE